MANSISFICWERDEKLEIQLEPEALVFNVPPGNEITFSATVESNTHFKWTVRVDDNSKSVQLIPGEGFTETEILENGVLLEDWYKYMRLI